MCTHFPVIDPVATGANIAQLRKERGLTVRDLQVFFGFEEPRAIYKWQRGQCLPSVDNLYALGALLDVSLDEILVPTRQHLNTVSAERQAESCRSAAFYARFDNSTMDSGCHGTASSPWQLRVTWTPNTPLWQNHAKKEECHPLCDILLFFLVSFFCEHATGHHELI